MLVWVRDSERVNEREEGGVGGYVTKFSFGSVYTDGTRLDNHNWVFCLHKRRAGEASDTLITK